MLDMFQGLDGWITEVPVVRACKMLEMFQGLNGWITEGLQLEGGNETGTMVADTAG